VAPCFLVSAGEASGDRYAARLVESLRRHYADADFFGCAGPEMRRAGVRPVVLAESLSVLGIVEVIHHIPRIYGEFRKLTAAASQLRPRAAILTDSPDFHLPLARRLSRRGIPVFYLVAPQAWAWRQGRVRTLKRNVREVLCIFPFEEEFFRQRGVPATYIGHPLSRLVIARSSRGDFFTRHDIPEGRPLITLCPGSRRGEIARHLLPLAEAVRRIHSRHPSTFVLAAPAGTVERFGRGFFEDFCRATGTRLVEGDTWDAMAHADLTLAASGTVTIEGALLNAPMVTYYRVSPVTYWLGRPLVRVPFYSMVNLVAGRAVVPELIQEQMRPDALARQALHLLSDPGSLEAMRAGLRDVARALSTHHDPLEFAAGRIARALEEETC
jgi:lipid-A-disaccharide synthase